MPPVAENPRLAKANFAFHACVSALVLTVVYEDWRCGGDLPGTAYLLALLIVFTTLRAWRRLDEVLEGH